MKKLLLLLVVLSSASAQYKDKTQGFGFNMGTRGTGLVYSVIWTVKQGFQTGVEGRIYDIKNEGEFPVYDYYTGTTQNVDDKALVLFPVMGMVKYFPFEGKIANNFSSFLSLKLGPVFSLDGKENEDSFKNRWGKAATGVTAGGNLALGVDFRYMGGMVISASMGYDILPMGKEIDGQSHYSGLLLNLSLTRAR